MIISIGSTNKVKIDALTETLKDYPLLSEAKIISHSVSSNVADQPTSLEETIRGAKNRAKNAFEVSKDSRYAFGIESGLIHAPGTQTGYIETSICCIYDGKSSHIGMSCGFEVPPSILNFVLNKKMDLNQASFHAKITTNTELGAAEGIIGLLTKHRIIRKEYTRQCIITALIQLENSIWYPHPNLI